MAERVKRRVAAARLAVAFVAAGAIAGAAASGQQNGPKPVLYKEVAAVDYFLKLDSIKSKHIVDGSLLFKDIKKGQVPSQHQFQKAQLRHKHFEKVVFHKYLSQDEASKLYIKGESLNDYIKHSEADARYIKMTDDVVRGDGSVFTETTLLGATSQQRLFSIAGLLDVDAVNGPSPHMLVTNNSGGPLTHTSCSDGAGGGTAAGVVAAGQSFSCPADDASQTVQLISEGANPTVATLSFSGVPAVQNSAQFTAQILIGM
jgi:hypothetical protein